MDSQFNAIDYAQQLAAAGVPQAQADVHARALSIALTTCCTTKADLTATEQKLTARMDSLEARMDLFEARVTARIDAFEATVDRQLAEMRAERKYDHRLINLVLALQVALLVKMFFP
jgi:hypothetical protein